MNRSERAIVITMRLIAGCGLFAIPAIFFPYSWMNAIHEFMGLGVLPDVPIVSYLARSLSAFYAIVSTITLFISSDIRRYRSLVKLMAIIVIAMGCVLLGIDLIAGMPTSWTLSEGPPTIAIGLVVLWLQRNISAESHGDHSS
ncbi:hypothetical protein [Novipirellula artificiosorum]|uniref:DoxX n=1 Tax=Novipirellula artificiosorum TaxID=2528016 RepID=A0A5C6E0F3_9BACT|nr:hypothetical protein [Novipirellula artificiosorum]TWU42388.1 hypothetical protein Poly41_06850 [Novipirellula artificiosorum]